MNRLIAIKLLWGLLCYLCYPSISIWWSRLWIISNTLDRSFEAFVIWCSVSYTRYISLSIPDLTLPSRALMHPIVYQNQSFQNVHLSNPVAIGLPAFGLHYLATTLAIQWKSWRLITSEGGRLRPTSFSTLPPIVAPKGGKPHALTSEQSADRLDNLGCVHINEWKYIFRVTYVSVATSSFYLN